MKRVSIFIAAVILLLSLAACGKKEPTESTVPPADTTESTVPADTTEITAHIGSKDELLAQLEGMWLADYTKDCCYVFRDGQVYFVRDAAFEDALYGVMDSVFEKKGVERLTELTFRAAIEELAVDALLGESKPCAPLEDQNGLAITDEKGKIQQQILVEEDSVSVTDAEGKNNVPLTKISDQTDFSAEHYATLFEDLKGRYTVPSSLFWTTAKSYAKTIRTLNPETNAWMLYSENENSTVYVPDKAVSSMDGSLIITDNSVTFMENTLEDGYSPVLKIVHNPAQAVITVTSNLGRTIEAATLVQYGNAAVKNYPGAYSNYMELYNALTAEAGTVESDVRTFEKTINGVSYRLRVDVNQEWAAFEIRTEETVSLANVIRYAKEPEASGQSFSKALDFSKAWTMNWADPDGYVFTAHYAFEGSGKFYLVISDGFELSFKGTGTFEVTEDIVSFDLVSEGKHQEYSYRFASSDLSLTQTSSEGLAYHHKQSEVFRLSVDEVNSFDKIKKWCVGESEEPDGDDSYVDVTEPTTEKNDCYHKYAEATCTLPETCTKCGETVGEPLGHMWQYTSCTTPKKCSVCGEEQPDSVPEHCWQAATCTQPETCSVCGETQGELQSHTLRLTRCMYCDHTDYSGIAKQYPNVVAYDSSTEEDLEVTGVSVSASGILSFTFNGKRYELTIKQRDYDALTCFDCYLNGSLLENATYMVGDESYYNMTHFEWDGVDGYALYFYTE